MAQHGSHPHTTWEVCHRYSAFHKFYKDLSGVDQSFAKIPFPPKTWWAASKTDIESRKRGISTFINQVVANREVDDDASKAAAVLVLFDDMFHVSGPHVEMRERTTGHNAIEILSKKTACTPRLTWMPTSVPQELAAS